jgi:glycosyltransferase involved in cell wall biosynthesis
MNNSPLISIIIPSYNYGNYIVAALESIVVQTFKDWECIVVDDGSTDDTAKRVADFISSNPLYDFKYICIPNSGTSAAKNVGIDLAKGKYIQFLDADDLLSPEKLEVQAQIIEQTDCALVYSRTVFFKESGATEQIISKYPEGFLKMESLSGLNLLSALVDNNILTISSPLVHKTLVLAAGMFSSTIRNNEDWLFWFKVAMLKPIFVFDNNPHSFTKVRIHATSAMQNFGNMFSGEVFVREQLGMALLTMASDEEKEILMKRNLDHLALHRIRSLDWSLGWKHVFSSFGKNPTNNISLLKQGCYQSLVRIFRLIVPAHGA